MTISIALLGFAVVIAVGSTLVAVNDALEAWVARRATRGAARAARHRNQRTLVTISRLGARAARPSGPRLPLVRERPPSASGNAARVASRGCA